MPINLLRQPSKPGDQQGPAAGTTLVLVTVDPRQPETSPALEKALVTKLRGTVLPSGNAISFPDGVRACRFATAWLSQNPGGACAATVCRGHGGEPSEGDLSLGRALTEATPTGAGMFDDRVWGAAQRVLPDGGLQTRALGVIRLSGIEGGLAATLVTAPGNAPPEDALVVLQAKTNLPSEPPPFFGRTLECDDIESLYLAGASTVVLVGPGGIGKTRLALRFAGMRLDETSTEGGSWHVGISRARRVSDVAIAVGTTLGIPLTNPDTVSQVGRALDSRGRMLILLDNAPPDCTGLADTLTKWSEMAPRCRFLVTSRERLYDDSDYEVGPLDADASKELFEDRARATRPDFAVDLETEQQISDLVERVDGIPLAIELAAGWVNVLTPIQLLERLEEGLEVLSTHPRRPDHTLQEVMVDTWERLDRWEQIALEQLSGFRGGFEIEALNQVLSLPSGYGAPDALQLLGQLRNRALVQMYEPPERPGEVRLRMYSAVRDFAEQRVRRSGRHASVWYRHAAWALELGEDLAQRAEAGDHDALSRLSMERHNLKVIAERRPRSTEAVRALLCLCPIYAMHGPWAEWEALMEDAVERARRMSLTLRTRALNALADARMARGKAEEVLGELEVLGEALMNGPRRLPSQESELFLRLAHARLLVGDHPAALEATEYALAVSNDVKQKAIAKAFRAQSHWARGAIEEARNVMTEAVDTLEMCDAGREEALYRLHLGDIQRTLGKPDIALGHYQRALSLYESLQDVPHLAMCSHRLGTLSLDLDKLDDARTHLAQALTRFTDIGDRRSESLVRGDIGRLEQLSNQPRKALTLFRRAHRTLKEVNDQRFLAIHLANEGSLQHELGHWNDARKALSQSLEVLEELGDERFCRLVALRLGALEADAGEQEAAVSAFRRADAIDCGEDPVAVATSEVHRAHLALMAGRDDTLVTRAIAQFEGTDTEPGIARRSADVRLAIRLLRAHTGQKLTGANA